MLLGWGQDSKVGSPGNEDSHATQEVAIGFNGRRWPIRPL